MKKTSSILILLLFLSIVGIAGCTSSDNNSSQISTNNQNTPQQINPNPVTPLNGSSNSSSSGGNSASSSSNSYSGSSSSSDIAGPFVGSVNSDVYHYPSCASAKRIKSENLITFSSVAEAKNAGYRPCKICNPPS